MAPHIITLINKQASVDRKNIAVTFFRVFGPVLLFALYNIGTIAQYVEYENPTNSGTIISPPQVDVVYPQKLYFGGEKAEQVASLYKELSPNVTTVTPIEKTKTLFQEICANDTSLGIFITSTTSWAYSFHVPGKNFNPYSHKDHLASGFIGAELVMNNVILTLEGKTPSSINRVQPLPYQDYTKKEHPGWALAWLPGMQITLCLAVGLMLAMGPIISEATNFADRAFILVGVSRRVYMLHWTLYYSLCSVASSVAFGIVLVVFNIFSKSSPVLIILSFQLMFIHVNCLLPIIPHFIKQREAANGLPFIVGFASLAICAFAFATDASDTVLVILSGISPFCGGIYFASVYWKWDWMYLNVGISSFGDIESSGLVYCYIGQLVGISISLAAVLLVTREASSTRISSGKIVPQQSQSQGNFEPINETAKVIIDINGLQKSFNKKGGGSFRAVDGLNMQICRDEIFGFLGHNGAGKTTTISLMSGELPLDGGEIKYNLSEQTLCVGNGQNQAIRQRIGVCPQHDILFGDLSCRETLRLFAKLKGGLQTNPGETTSQAVERQVEKSIRQVKFTSPGDEDKPVKTFSGGMRRKVSIAIAMLGDPEILFLDEPTAGMDPFNRRIVWDMIVEAKKGKSIVLTTHFMDEADVLSDRIGIIKNGKLVTCGTSLFLKHVFGAGYTLQFKTLQANSENITREIIAAIDSAKQDAQVATDDGYDVHQWKLPYGSEAAFPQVLGQLESCQNVVLDVTTLESVFLKTATEDQDDTGQKPEALVDDALVKRVWQKQTKRQLPFLEKLGVVERFTRKHAYTQPGAFAINLIFPVLYLIGGFLIPIPPTGEHLKVDPPIPVGIYETTASMFGFNASSLASPQAVFPAPQSLEAYFDRIYLGGIANNTYLFNHTQDWSLSAIIQAVTNHTLLGKGVSITLEPLPYYPDPGFDILPLVLPVTISFGLVGMVMCVLDILSLKEENVFSLFKVVGISQWMTYLGVFWFKVTTNLLPALLVLFVSDIATHRVFTGEVHSFFGLLATIVGYAYSVTPLGLYLSTKITGSIESVRNWFPGVYMTAISLPFGVYRMLLFTHPEDEDVIVVVGDILSILPPFAFQRAISFVVSNDYQWRAVYSIGIMYLSGTFLWKSLYSNSWRRAQRTPGSPEPIAVTDTDVVKERDRALEEIPGIRVLDTVKTFTLPPTTSKYKYRKFDLWGYWFYKLFTCGRDPFRNQYKNKTAVKGISFGVKNNETLVLVGPNGSGKTTLCKSMLGEITAEHGQVSLGQQTLSPHSTCVDDIFTKETISSCPQFDALFLGLTVKEHFDFYALVRGLDLKEQGVQDHIDALITTLSLRPHLHKKAKALSGGYKRKLNLGIAIVGFPSAILLDEPTTGMDPSNRRNIHKILKVSEFGTHGYDTPPILLSTHYLDEATTLGTRIGIMINGEMITTGTMARLREKHCTSNFVQVALHYEAQVNTDELVVEYFEQNGVSSSVYESFPGMFKLQVPAVQGQSNASTLSKLFSLLESSRTKFKMKYYAVAQMSLEQIFINLSRDEFSKI